MKLKSEIVTSTPSTLSTKRWPLFLFKRSAVIESEYEFKVAGTTSYGELLCSTLRHRLFYTNKIKNVESIVISSLRLAFGLPAKTTLFTCFEIISIDSDHAR